MHTHDHHNDDHHHDHDHQHEADHDHGHTHSHDDGQAHHHDSHDGLLGSKAEAAAFLQYTLHHNAHHEEELSGLVHSLQHLSLEQEAGEVAACIAVLNNVNARLEAVLGTLK